MATAADARVPAASPGGPPVARTGLRTVVRTAGEVVLTLGLLLLLLVVYQVGWTNVTADRAAQSAARQLEATWHGGTSGVVPTGEYPGGIHPGRAFAFVYLPRLGADWREPLIEGVSLDDLARGVGHYPASALPGQVGNLAIAGHRATHGEPFAALDRIRAGDVAVVETATTWYVYRLQDPYLVQPTDVAVVAAVPGHPGEAATQRLITLTTCNPRWASYQRMIIHGTLVERRAKTAGPPAELAGRR
jgi:sortase A